MEQNDLILMTKYKNTLLKALGKVILEKRKSVKKGINKFSFEYDIGNGLLSRLENGKSDVKISTLWKIANAMGVKLSEIIKIVEAELGEDFNFYN